MLSAFAGAMADTPLWETPFTHRTLAVCISEKHDLVILFEYGTRRLQAHSLRDGTFRRDIGTSRFGNDACITPDGDSVLVAEYSDDRIHEVRIADGETYVLGLGLLVSPAYIDCNEHVVVVTEINFHRTTPTRISVLSRSGVLLARTAPTPGLAAVKLLANGREFVAMDNATTCCLRVFGLDGVLRTVLKFPSGIDDDNVIEDPDAPGSFIVRALSRLDYGIESLCSVGQGGSLTRGTSIALFIKAYSASPSGVVVASHLRVQFYTNRSLRRAWLLLCCIAKCK